MRGQPDGEKHKRDRESARAGLVLGNQNFGAEHLRSERADGRNQQCQTTALERGERDEVKAPQPKAAENNLLRSQDALKARAREPPQ